MSTRSSNGASKRGEGDEHGATSRHVRNAIAGDRESLDWVVRRFAPLLRAQAEWRLGTSLRGKVDPDDVVAEAWLVVLRRLPDLDGDEGRRTPRLVAFVGTVVLNIANRHMDHAARRLRTFAPQSPASDASDPVDELEATVTGAVTGAARDELGAALAAALGALPEADRRVVLLRIAEGRTNEEAAEELGEASNTVSRRYRRALAKLRASLPPTFFEDFAEE
jgi:RNA polymerase sigma-70 factor, ECF subfamily